MSEKDVRKGYPKRMSEDARKTCERQTNEGRAKDARKDCTERTDEGTDKGLLIGRQEEHTSGLNGQ